VIKSHCQEKTGEKEMFSDADGRQTEKMLRCRMAMVYATYAVLCGCDITATLNRILPSTNQLWCI